MKSSETVENKGFFAVCSPNPFNLNAYLAGIDQQAQERLETLVKQMRQAQGITEQLKDENALEWVQRMNNVRACAMEIVNSEMIYA